MTPHLGGFRYWTGRVTLPRQQRATPDATGAAPCREDAGSTVYFLLHLPRTGGNTIAAHLKAHLNEGLCVPSRPAGLELLGRRRYRLDAVPDFARVRAVTGHYLGRSLETEFVGRRIRRTLLLRDPVGFHVSYYNHRMMFSLSRGGPTWSFERHLRAQPRDLVAILLLWYWMELPLRAMLATGDARKYELLNKALAGFWFVGSHEDGDRLTAAIAGDLGIPAAAPRKNTTPQWQKRVDWRPLHADELSAAARARILAQNPIHDALWHGWRDAGFDTARQPTRQWPSGGGGLGLRDLLRGITADRFIAPIWRRAGRASRAGDWPRAARLYRKALLRVPNAPEVWVQYGHALKEAGDTAAAEAAYRRATELGPDNAEWHLFLGQALALLGRIDEAREALARFERLDPAALARQRDQLAALGCPEDAVRLYWRSLSETAGR